MHRFYITPNTTGSKTVQLSDREAHHALNVVRVRDGERVVAMDGAGHEYSCEVKLGRRQEVWLEILQSHAVPPLPYQITLIQALTKGKAMDMIVQKATELGVHRIVPIICARSVAVPEPEESGAKTEKWEWTAIDSIKQCGSAWLPRMESPVTPSAYLARNERYDLTLMATLQGDARHPRAHLENFVAERGATPKSVAVWVGPEGDFTPAEINAIRASGALPITLGQLVLRSETAAIYCLSVLNYELQWPGKRG